MTEDFNTDLGPPNMTTFLQVYRQDLRHTRMYNTITLVEGINENACCSCTLSTF